MASTSITVEAVFEDGALHPLHPLPLSAHQRVTLIVQVPIGRAWPEDVAAIYQELADADRRLAADMLPQVKETWPESEAEA